ncbi:MAG: type II toxin-antitoxin system HicA family toxin [Pseudonocardiales bacterium]
MYSCEIQQRHRPTLAGSTPHRPRTSGNNSHRPPCPQFGTKRPWVRIPPPRRRSEALSEIIGSHRVYSHPTKSGIVVLPGKLGKDLPLGTERSILRQAGLR